MWLVARALPCAAAASVGSALMRTIGPLMRKHQQVLRNLHQVVPEADPVTLRRLARDVWSNLGAVLFEYPHVEHIVDSRVRVTASPASQALLDAKQPVLVVTAHLANWEVLASYLGRRTGGMAVVYSPDDNPIVDRMIQRFRASSGCEYVTKQEALRRLTPKFLRGRSVGLLPDVRVDSGPSLPLFGAGAPTTISPARLAARLGYPLVPMRVKRLGPARFEIDIEEPLAADPEQIGKRAAVDLMARFNLRLEHWISERPGEWLCTKRRWPKDARHYTRPEARREDIRVQR
jgi:Kdo2-lipid IVA lauroyltransferase/acyltransferase